MASFPDKCPLWGPEFSARVSARSRQGRIDVESPRTGGCFCSDKDVLSNLHELSKREKAKLTTWLIERRRQGEDWPRITQDVIDAVARTNPLPVYTRADRLLQHLSEITTEFGMPLSAPFKPYVAHAISESTSDREVGFLRDFLADRGWILDKPGWSGMDTALKVDGLARVEQLTVNADSPQAFVAMWIDSSLDSAYVDGFKPAIEDCGYVAMRIDQKPDVDKLDDEIIAEIRRSRFVVADLSQDNKGARGSVYFEAGFAMGTGLPVIFTCHKEWDDDFHFDIRQYAHIVWDSSDNLRKSLSARISARPRWARY